MKLFFSIIIGLTGLIFFPVSILLADDFNSIQWREALVTVEMDLNPIDGHEAHALGILQQRGFAFYEDGQVATIQAWLTFERSGPITSYSGYAVYDFTDGSTKVARLEGTGDPGGEQQGNFTIQTGSGRFKGITGEGNFVGHGFAPYGDIYVDVTARYLLP